MIQRKYPTRTGGQNELLGSHTRNCRNCQESKYEAEDVFLGCIMPAAVQVHGSEQQHEQNQEDEVSYCSRK